MCDQKKEVVKKCRQETLRVEYQEASENIRIYQQARYEWIGKTITLLTIFSSAYLLLLSNKSTLGRVADFGMFLISLFAPFIFFWFWMILERTRMYFLIYTKRALELEDELGMGENGQYHKVWAASSRLPFWSYTWVMRGLYFFFIGFWLVCLYYVSRVLLK